MPALPRRVITQGWLDNVVELLVPLPSVRLPFLPPPEPTPAPGLRATLRHTYEVAQPNKVTIVFESTLVQAIGPELLQVRHTAFQFFQLLAQTH